MTDPKAAVEQAIAGHIDPYLGKSLGEAKAVRSVDVDPRGVARVVVDLGYPPGEHAAAVEQALGELARAVADVTDVQVEVRGTVVPHAVQRNVKPLPGVKNIVAVASGKGGVGKSTVAANLAVALARQGAQVGVLDADIYGPSQPRMLGAHGQPESRDGQSLEPKRSHGVQSISIGHLIEEDTPMVWRGPMATGALQQLLNETRWQDLDYLIVDLPPGTGDIQLTLAQQIPVAGAVIVTTPQDIALLDARKALKMFEKVDVAVLGIVENMSVHVCPQCGHEEHIFGAGGGQQMASQYGVELLGQLPLARSIREGVDRGEPTVASEPDSPVAAAWHELARHVAGRLAARARDYSARFPDIVVENS